MEADQNTMEDNEMVAQVQGNVPQQAQKLLEGVSTKKVDPRIVRAATTVAGDKSLEMAGHTAKLLSPAEFEAAMVEFEGLFEACPSMKEMVKENPGLLVELRASKQLNAERRSHYDHEQVDTSHVEAVHDPEVVAVAERVRNTDPAVDAQAKKVFTDYKAKPLALKGRVRVGAPAGARPIRPPAA